MFDDEPKVAEFDPLVENLVKAFAAVTMTNGKGLELSLVYYDKDNGDRYDEVENKDGCIFDVEGVYSYTPAGQRFKDKLQNSNFVTFG